MDSTLAASRYLHSGAFNLRYPSGVLIATLRYNYAAAYALNVLGRAATYATGVIPVDSATDYQAGAATRRRTPRTPGRN
nr:hypothetical protein [Mycobacterium uberis]